MWAGLIRLRVPELRMSGYVDDRSMRSQSVYELQQGINATVEFDEATLQESHPVKTSLWTIIASHKKYLKELRVGTTQLPIVDFDKQLGVQERYSKKNARPWC